MSWIAKPAARSGSVRLTISGSSKDSCCWLRLELDIVATTILSEENRLLANFPREDHLRRHRKLHPSTAQSVRNRLPEDTFYHRPEVPDRGFVAAGDDDSRGMASLDRLKVRHQMIAEKIEIDPVARAATFRAAQQTSIKIAGALEAGNRHGKMHRAMCHSYP